MGRPPTNGTPSFCFTESEVEEMESVLQVNNNKMPAREALVAIADKFSNSAERQGKILVQTKQIWNWFQNKRDAIRVRSSKSPTKLTVSSMQSASTVAPVAPFVSTMPAMQETPAVPVAPTPTIPVVSGKLSSDNIPMEFEARSAQDGAWYDVSEFLSLKNLEAGEPEVLVRFAGFGPEEDEWINVRQNVRHRSLPCEPSECVAVLPGDLVLCFQEGKERALYFDAHVLDAQRQKHDIRRCRCRFLVRYGHDQSEEIVQLKKICRRPETEYRLQQLHAINESSAEQGKVASATQNNTVTVTSVGLDKPDDLSFSKTDKTSEDMNAGPSGTQQCHSEMVNLDPGNKEEKNMLEAQDATDFMAVEETLEKPCHDLETKNIIPVCGTDATATTCNTFDQTDGDSRTEPNATEVVTNEAAYAAAGTDPVAEHVQEKDDSEQMLVETHNSTGEGRTDIDISKIDPARSIDPHMPKGAEITDTNLPDETCINIADGRAPAVASNVSSGITLDGLIDVEKTDVGPGNVTLASSDDNADYLREDTDKSDTNKMIGFR